MWHEITDSDALKEWMEEMACFHDSCIKEIQYISGAFVNDCLMMHPVNSRRILRVLILRQCRENSAVELEFEGLCYCRLSPVDETYDCIIGEASLAFRDGGVCWRDVEETRPEEEGDTMIRAARLRWRTVEHGMGDGEYYGGRG